METTQTAKTENPEVDVTKFVNVDQKESFDIYINGKVVRHLNPGETDVVPIYVGLAGAKHLVDRILQRDHGIKDSLRDSPLRRSLFASILPDRAEERNIKPLTESEFRSQVLETLKKQQEGIEALSGKTETNDKLDNALKEIEELKAQLAKQEEAKEKMRKVREAKKTKTEEKVA